MRVLSIKLMLAAVLMAFLPLVASADTGFYQGAIFGVGTDGGTLLVADDAHGVVNGDDGSLIAALPGVTERCADSRTTARI